MAYHFGRLDKTRHDYAEYDYRLSEAMVSYWTNFAKYGDPNGGVFPRWTPFTEKTPYSMHFRDDGWGSENLVDNPMAERVIRYCSVYPGVIENIKPYVLPYKLPFNTPNSPKNLIGKPPQPLPPAIR
jgi:hypothetical protein